MVVLVADDVDADVDDDDVVDEDAATIHTIREDGRWIP